MLLRKNFNKKIYILFIFSLVTLNIFSAGDDDDDIRPAGLYRPGLMFVPKTQENSSVNVDTKDTKIKASIYKATDSMPTRFAQLFKNKKFKPCILNIKNDSDYNIILNREEPFFFQLSLPYANCKKSLEPSKIRRWINNKLFPYKYFVKKTDIEDFLNYTDANPYSLTIYDKETLKNNPNQNLENTDYPELIIPKKSFAEFIIFLSNDDWSRLNNKQDKLTPRLSFKIQPACDN